MNTYWRLLGFAKPIEKYAIPYFFYTLFYTIFYTFTFMLIMPLLNTLFVEDQLLEPVTALPSFALNTDYFRSLVNFLIYRVFGTDYSKMDVLIFLSVFIILMSFLSNLFRYLGQRVMETMRVRSLQRLRNRVYDNVMGLHVGYFNNERKGDIISKISSDVQVVQFCITNTLLVAFRDPFMIVGFLIALVMISWKLTIFSVIFLPVVALVIGSIVKRLRKSATAAQERFADMVSLMDESLTGIKILKGYNATDYIRNKFHDINGLFSRISLSMARRQQLASPTSEFLGISAAAVLMVYGGSLVLSGDLEASAFVAYLSIFTQITRPLRSFTDSFANINQGIAAGERVLALLDEKSKITNAPDAVRMTGLHDEIEFRDVRFSYGNKEVICGVNFKIRKGETVALVGPSGGGKSTLSDLIPRFYDIQGGAILIDGVDIRRYDIESLREYMGVVSQETILFNDTIANNLRLGKQDATDEEIRQAAVVANAHNFIMETEHGYQTNIGDRGMKLSGGQRQRLSIARAVLKNPEILILDEATSALDTESEKLVQEALNALLKGRTSLVIAHRLSTIHNADRIIVIEKGRIAEQGTHQQLMERHGIYARLIEMQQVEE
ncbi:Putative multidrug export ATP-binding/permease protein SAV1866 [Alistipes sp. cv1]|nr:ABC transporter ATP-binding protein [uncultured Alistipes sp.]VDR36260.1 Putative multidrug export ATP-binding/permease protein SAV1866 [Faecalibacterium prausnitzii]